MFQNQGEWDIFVLVVNRTCGAFATMDFSFDVVEKERKQMIDYYTIERWTYKTRASKDTLIKREKVNGFGIDIPTAYKEVVISKLAKLVTTLSIRDGGIYEPIPEYSSVWVKTLLSEKELGKWLEETSFPEECEIIGTFEKEW